MTSLMQSRRQDDMLRQTFVEAMRFWERRRVIYNLILLSIVVAWFVLTWPHFRPALTWLALFQFTVLGALANLCYCAAYIVDLPLRSSQLGTAWARWRWVLWSIGTLFAVALTNYWIADEIYPFVR